GPALPDHRAERARQSYRDLHRIDLPHPEEVPGRKDLPDLPALRAEDARRNLVLLAASHSPPPQASVRVDGSVRQGPLPGWLASVSLVTHQASGRVCVSWE